MSRAKHWDDWLDWGSGIDEDLVTKSLSVTIGNHTGTYYGEWMRSDSQLIVHGRGLLICYNIFILGYLDRGNWAVGSMQVAVCRNKQMFGVFSL